MANQKRSSLLLSAVRKRLTEWPKTAGEISEQFLAEVQAHAVGPLLYGMYENTASWKSWPEHVRSTLKEEYLQSSLVAENYRQELSAILEALKQQDIDSIILKGLRLAFSGYPDPAQRPFCDADLYVPYNDFDSALACLRLLGFQESQPMMGRHIRFEHCLEKKGPGEVWFYIDLHWQLSSLLLPARALPDQLLQKNLITLSKLGPHARGLNDTLSFIHAAVHLLSQHRHTEDLLWLYDMKLLIEDKNEPWFARLFELINNTALAPFCSAALIRLQEVFPDVALLENPALAGGTGREFLSAKRYIESSGRWWDNLRADLSALPGVCAKLHYLRQHLFPPAEFMLSRFNTKNRFLLPWLYIQRIVGGSKKLGALRG